MRGSRQAGCSIATPFRASSGQGRAPPFRAPSQGPPRPRTKGLLPGQGLRVQGQRKAPRAKGVPPGPRGRTINEKCFFFNAGVYTRRKAQEAPKRRQEPPKGFKSFKRPPKKRGIPRFVRARNEKCDFSLLKNDGFRHPCPQWKMLFFSTEIDAPLHFTPKGPGKPQEAPKSARASTGPDVPKARKGPRLPRTAGGGGGERIWGGAIGGGPWGGGGGAATLHHMLYIFVRPSKGQRLQPGAGTPGTGSYRPQ